MAGRIRTIKPELLEDERTAALSHEAFRLFIGMILLADDHGALRANAAQLAGQIFWCSKPREGLASLLEELARVSLVSLYTVRGQQYAQLTGWTKHQRVDKPSKPRVPRPEEAKYEENQILVQNSRDPRDTLATHSTTLAPDPDPDLRSPITDHDPYIAQPGTAGHVCAAPRWDAKKALDDVYALFPRKEGKSRGLSLALKAIRTPADMEDLRTAVVNYTQHVRGRERQYVKQFSTFMACWRDYLDPAVTAPPAHVNGSGAPARNLTARDMWERAMAAEAAELAGKGDS